MIPVYKPWLTSLEKKYLNEAIDSGWISSTGKFIEKAEKLFADFIGVKHCVLTSSGTTALHLCIRSLNLPEGSSIIVPNITFVATAFAAAYDKHNIIFTDVDPETWNIDIGEVAFQCQYEKNNGRHVSAVIPVHLYGNPCDMVKLLELQHEYGFRIIEDACESLGASIDGWHTGAMGDVGCFSFYGNKSFSVTGDTALYIKYQNNVKVIQAKELDDLDVNSLECASFSPIDGTIKWVKPQKIISHIYNGDIIRIKLRYGKSVDVTKDHCLFILRDGKIIDASTSDIQIDDYVVCPRSLPDNLTIDKIDILNYVDKKDVWRATKHNNHAILEDINAGLSYRATAQKHQTSHQMVSKIKTNPNKIYYHYDRQLDLADEIIIEATKKIRGGYRKPINRFIKINKNFCKLIGYYIAEGSNNSQGSTFSFHSNEIDYHNEIERIWATLNRSATTHKKKDANASNVIAGGKIYAKLLTSLCGRLSHDKHLPDFAFNLMPEHKIGLLKGLFNGDGCYRKNNGKLYLELKTTSKRLAIETQYLLLSLGIVSAMEITKAGVTKFPKYISKTKIAYKVRISDNNAINLIGGTSLKKNYCGILSDMVPTEQFDVSTNHARKNQESIKSVPFLGKDLAFLQVVGKEIIRTGSEKVYDLSVPDRFENFIGGFGGICLHNSSGEGGALVTNDDWIADRARLLRGQAQDPQKRYWHIDVGYNYRITNMQAAILCGQLERADEIMREKERVADLYYLNLAGTNLQFQKVLPGHHHSNWLFSVMLPSKYDPWMGLVHEVTNEEFSDYMRKHDIDTRKVFYPITHMPPFQSESRFTNSERLSLYGLSLPSYPELTNKEIDHICQVIKSHPAIV